MALSWASILWLVGCGAALEGTHTSNVSERCTEDINSFLWEINHEGPEEYAALMYDAYGKIGSNVEGGNTNRPGCLQQCRSAHAPTFSGQYCQVFLKQGTLQYFVGICVPDSCVEEEVQMLVLNGRLQMGETSLVPPLPGILVNESTQEMIMTHCSSSVTAVDASDVTSLFVCCLMLACPLAATLFVAILRWQHSRDVCPAAGESTLSPNTTINLYGTVKSNSASSGGNSTISLPQHLEMSQGAPEKSSSVAQRFMFRYLHAFSLQTTSQGVLSTSSSVIGGSFSSLNGIRVLSLLWIICGHSAQFPIIINLDNYKSWEKSMQSSPLYVLTLSGPVFLAVDTFLLLGGLLSAKSLLGSIHRAEDRLSLSVVSNYLIKRFKRVQPLHLFIMCVTIGLVSVVHWGPYWFPFVDTVMGCKTYWWANLLLVSNLLPVNKICVPWTWYLSLDFQCYATTPLLVYLYRLNRRVFALVVSGLLLTSIVTSAAVTAHLQLPVSLPSTLTSENYSQNYYMKPYTRYGPFLVGIVTGIYLASNTEPLLKRKWLAALGWLCCLSLAAVLVGLAYVLREAPAYPSAPHALYQGLHRPLWALVVTWIILACEEGYGGCIHSLLSHGLWVPLSNISFACYMTHPIFIILYLGLQETPIHYTDVNFMYLFFGHVVLTLGASLVLSMLIEKPYLLLKWTS